jgi:chromosome segregation ATPase
MKSKLRKMGGKTALRAKDLRAQLRREFAIANDILTRIKDLKREKELIEAQAKDLKDQGDYYQSLLDDPSMTLFNRTEINNKINKINRKISTIERLIKNIQNAISKSVAYIKEYLKVWDRANTRLEKFREDSGYKPLSSEEIKSLIDSVDAADQATLKDYPNLTRQLNKLESDVIESMDTVELLDEVKQSEETRLNELQAALSKYDRQLRYLNALLEPISDDVKSNPITDKTSESPKPTETVKASAENQKQTTEAVERAQGDKVVASFSLSDITDLGTAIQQADQLSPKLVSMLDRINEAETIENVRDLTKDLSEFKPAEVRRIAQEAKEKIKSLKSDFKESVENQVDTVENAEYIVVKSFDGIPTGTMLTVTNIDGDNVTIKIVNEDQQKTVKFDTLNGNVMTPEEAKSKTVVETIEITPEVKTVIGESIVASNSLSDDTIDKIVKEVEKKELKDLENDLYNLEIC